MEPMICCQDFQSLSRILFIFLENIQYQQKSADASICNQINNSYLVIIVTKSQILNISYYSCIFQKYFNLKFQCYSQLLIVL